MNKILEYLETRPIVRLATILSMFIGIIVSIPIIYHWVFPTQNELQHTEPTRQKYDTVIIEQKPDNLSVHNKAKYSDTNQISIKSDIKNDGIETPTNIPNVQSEIKKTVTCTECNGTGTIKIQSSCDACNGKGKIICPQCSGTGKWGDISPTKGIYETPVCSKCLGIGKTKCTDCLGTGEMSTTKTCPKCNGLGHHF